MGMPYLGQGIVFRCFSTEALLQLRRGGAAPVWRSNVAAELALVTRIQNYQVGPVTSCK